ncbi:MAG: DUF2029 domain-containing protein [Roseiflexaceae bacterium]|nr:DUF2029 domain-containing protein [Roseiflexaceae bacterium]
MRNVPRLASLLAVLPALVLALGAQLSWPLVAEWHGDLGVYAGYADQVMQGQVPYRDFTLEYPPLALVPFVLPRLAVAGAALDEAQFRALFLLQSALFVWVITLVSQQLVPVERRGQMTLVLALFVAVLSPFLAWRFDLFPAMLTGLALLAATRNRWSAAGFWLGLGIAAKLYPVVVGPVLVLGAFVAANAAPRLQRVVPAWFSAGAARTWRLCLGAAATLAVIVLPFYLIAPEGLLGFLGYHQQRGIQIESVAGGIVSLAALVGLTDARSEFNYGALHLVSPWADALLPWLFPLLAVLYTLLLAIGIWRVARVHTLSTQMPCDTAWLGAMVCAALFVFVVSNKVFSPQYLVWLLPFLPLLRWAQIVLAALICVATVAIFPFGYAALIAAEPWAIVLLNARNLATLSLLLWLAAGLMHAVPQRYARNALTDAGLFEQTSAYDH